MKEDRIRELIIKEGLDMQKLIDVVVDINGIIGVGIIRLADDTHEYIMSKLNTNKRNRKWNIM